MEESEYVTLVITVPVSHVDEIREALGNAGAGDVDHYSHCSFSYPGTGRFKPKSGSNPHIGKQGQMETVSEEKIQAYCKKAQLESVLDAVKKAHPYEETIIDILPVYTIGMKRGRD